MIRGTKAIKAKGDKGDKGDEGDKGDKGDEGDPGTDGVGIDLSAVWAERYPKFDGVTSKLVNGNIYGTTQGTWIHDFLKVIGMAVQIPTVNLTDAYSIVALAGTWPGAVFLNSDDPTPANRVFTLASLPTLPADMLYEVKLVVKAGGCKLAASDPCASLAADWEPTSEWEILALAWDTTTGKFHEEWRYPALGGSGVGVYVQVAGDTMTGPLVVPTITGTNFRNAQATLAYAATTTLDFDNPSAETVTLAGNIIFDTAHRAANGMKKVRIICDGTNRTFTFPVGWHWLSAMPLSIAAGKSGILSLECWGSNDTDIFAVYAPES